MTLLYSHESCIAHDMGEGHPEQPDRLRVILKGLSAPEFVGLNRIEAPLAHLDSIALVHPLSYVENILASVPMQGYARIDGDTALNSKSGEAARHAVGAVIQAVDDICGENPKDKTAFCAIRPPGHHAEPDQAMGFCLFNNVAIGAAYAREAYGLKKCAIIDFDVHHGNGTEAYIKSQPDFLYISTHQSPLYPGTGAAESRGPYGNIANFPMGADTNSQEYRSAVMENILPMLEDYAPELIFISAGFDAHVDDPLAQMALTEDDFAWFTARLMEVADKYSQGRIISALEGGYNLVALEKSTCAHVRQLMCGG